MNTALSEALTPLSKRMPRAVRDIEILRVSAQLDGEDYAASAEAARKEALKWAKKRAGRALPKAAWDLQDFDLPVGGRSSTAVRMRMMRSISGRYGRKTPIRTWPGASGPPKS